MLYVHAWICIKGGNDKAGIIAVAPGQGGHCYLSCPIFMNAITPMVCMAIQHQPASFLDPISPASYSMCSLPTYDFGFLAAKNYNIINTICTQNLQET